PPPPRSIKSSPALPTGFSEQRTGGRVHPGRAQSAHGHLVRPAALAVALLGAGAGAWQLSARCVAAPKGVRSPLADPSTIIACPVFIAVGVPEPAGWLGAAAAATACERARVILGGRPERTFVPAELLDLPRAPIDSFQADPYGRTDARNITLTAAQSR